MARVFSVGTIPKNIPTWQYNAFRQIAAAITGNSDGMSAILRGEAPDGSGLPLVDTSKFFYKPGLSGGQVAFGGVNATDSLTLSSTSAQTKNFIYFDSTKTLMAFDENQGYLGIGIVTPAALLHLYTASAIMARFQPSTFTINCTSDGSGGLVPTTTGQFAPSGGPRVVPGMYVTSSAFSIPANTQVKHLINGSALTLTASAAAGTGDVVFQTYVDILQVSDESGRDMTYRTAGAIRFQPGTTGIPLRIDGDTLPIASGIADSGRVFLEAGYISGGSAIGSDFQIGGPGHGELGRLYLSTRVIWIARDPTSGTNVNVGLNVNPAEMGGGFGPGWNLMSRRGGTNNVILFAEAGAGTNVVLGVFPWNDVAGSSPNKTIGTGNYMMKFTEDARLWIGNAAGSGFYFWAPGGQMFCYDQNSKNLISVASNGTAWSDAVTTGALYIGDSLGTPAGRRATISSISNTILNRFGVSSTYSLICNAANNNSGFLAPATVPEVLQVLNAVTGGADGAVVLRVRTARAGQTANLQEWITSGGAVKSAINAAGSFAGNTTLVSYDDNLVLIDDDTVYY